jgi:hypothetical protein
MESVVWQFSRKKAVAQMLPNNFEEKTFTIVEKVA